MKQLIIHVHKMHETWLGDVARYARAHRIPEERAKDKVSKIAYVQVMNMPQVDMNQTNLKEVAHDIVGHPYFDIEIK